MTKCCLCVALAMLLACISIDAQPAAHQDVEPTAGIELPWVLSSGMVVQRDRPIPVWGTADPGEGVTVTFADQTKATTADAEGAWRVELDALPASAWGRAMTIAAGDATRVLTDVLVGEVWVCAGQSNMWWPLRSSVGGDAAAARVAASHTLRLLDPQPTVGLGGAVWPMDDALALTPGRYFSVNGWTRGDTGAAGDRLKCLRFAAQEKRRIADIQTQLLADGFGALGADVLGQRTCRFHAFALIAPEDIPHTRQAFALGEFVHPVAELAAATFGGRDRADFRALVFQKICKDRKT